MATNTVSHQKNPGSIASSSEPMDVTGASEETTAVPSPASSSVDGGSKQEVAAISAPRASLSTLRAILLVATATTAMIVNVGNGTSVSIALPTIGRELHVQESELQWLVSAYALSSGCLLLVFGRVADVYGRKLTFMGGSIFLTALTIGCAFPNDIITLDILRGIQGIGGAAMIPASIGILAHEFPPSRARSLAFATFSAGAPVGAVLGTALGGVLTEYSNKTWRAPFYLMAGITFLSAIGGYISIGRDPPSQETDRRIDWLGALLVSAGLVLIVFVLGQGELAPNRWGTPYIIALLITGVVLVVVFLFWQNYLEGIQNDPNAPYSWYTPPPLMKISIWTRGNGRFAAMMVIALVNWCAFMAFTFWVQLFYQDYLQLSAVNTVLRFLPMFVSGVLCNVFVGIFAARVPIVYLTVIGTGATAGACLLFALINPSSTFWAFGFPAAVISVLGADFVFSAGTIYVAKVALPHEQSVGGALFTTMTQLGTALGLTVSTVVFNQVTRRDPDGDRLESYRAAQWTCFSFGVLGAVLSFIFFRGVGAVGDRKQKARISEKDEGTTDVEDGARDTKS